MKTISDKGGILVLTASVAVLLLLLNASASCSETDNRIDYKQQGTIYSDNLGTKTDTCNGNNLTEYYCSLGKGHNITTKCPDGCEEGACRAASCSETDNRIDYTHQGTIISNNIGTKTDTCKDTNYLIEYYCSTNKGYNTTTKCIDGCQEGACQTPTCSETDNRIDYYQQGTAYSNNLGTKTDTCKNPDYLIEYYCGSDHRTHNTTTRCRDGCQEGTCITPTCSETDNGIDYYQHGTIYSNKIGTQTDTCKDTNYLTEYYCTSDHRAHNITKKCPNGCEEGECETESSQYCSETDDGKDYYQQGTIYSNNLGTKTDTCGGNKLTEYYCSANKAYSTTYNCPNGYTCSSGECKTESSDYYCYETDDGRDYTEKGKTYSNEGTKEDKCFDKKSLTEYYCSGNRVYSEKILCDNSCIDGACTRASTFSDYCSDSDGGKDYSEKGITYSSNLGTKTDTCSGNTMTEYYCSGKEGYSMSYVCEYGCANGACKTSAPSDYCSDSEGGMVYTVKGTTSSYNLGTKTDTCSGNKLTEYYCTANKAYSTTYNCPNGYTCTNGECTASSASATCPSDWGSGWSCTHINGRIQACQSTNCWCSDGDWETWVPGKCAITSTSTSWTCYSDWTCYDEGSRVKAVKGASVVCTYDKTGIKNNQNVNWFGC